MNTKNDYVILIERLINEYILDDIGGKDILIWNINNVEGFEVCIWFLYTHLWLFSKERRAQKLLMKERSWEEYMMQRMREDFPSQEAKAVMSGRIFHDNIKIFYGKGNIIPFEPEKKINWVDIKCLIHERFNHAEYSKHYSNNMPEAYLILLVKQDHDTDPKD